jgi:plastocyanin
MKMKKLIFLLLIISSTTLSYGKVWMVINSAYTFSPATLTIDIGDSVLFTLATIHNAVEVSQITWTANGVIALPGGFSEPLGGGLVPASKLTLGTHWYVCTLHVGTMGMKGTIIVLSTSGIKLNQQPDISISLYPNPATSLLHLNLNEPQQAIIRIISILGQDIMQLTAENGENTIDVSKLAEGTYFVVVISNKKRIYSGKLNIIK